MNHSEKCGFASGRESHSGNSIRTLVVDDSPMAINAISALLKSRQGIEVVGFAVDGEEGLSRAEDLRPDLILMDLQMPKLDGLSASRLIRGRLPGVRIIVVTVNHGKEVRQQCMSGGADGFVVKDRLYQELFNEIRRVFEPDMQGCFPPPVNG